MKKQGVKAVALSTVISAGALLSGMSYADPVIDQIMKVGQAKVAAAKGSQERINALTDSTRDIIGQYKGVVRDIEGLKLYNAQYSRQLENQRKVIQELEESIDQVTVLERQVQPLIMSMLEGLEQFVNLDMPFRLEERTKRIEQLRENQDSAKITVAEKFRQVLEAYSIEAEYGRKVETYVDTLDINGEALDVNMLAIGRVALLYQSKDGKLTGAWDKSQKAWVELDPGQYRAAVLKGIKVAKKQASIDVLQLPILAPEAAQ